MGPTRGPFGVSAGSVRGSREDPARSIRGPRGVRSGPVRGPFGVRSGSVWDPFGVRSGSVRDPKTHINYCELTLGSFFRNSVGMKPWMNQFGYMKPWIFKRNTGPRDQILPVSVNSPTNYSFALLSKLPTNYTKFNKKYTLRTKMHCFAVRSRRFFVFFLNFLCNLLVTLKAMQNCNLLANL